MAAKEQLEGHLCGNGIVLYLIALDVTQLCRHPPLFKSSLYAHVYERLTLEPVFT